MTVLPNNHQLLEDASESRESDAARDTGRDPKLLNLGCGNRFHPEWINIDCKARSREVLEHDLTTGIPFGDEIFDAVYHSHVLEHFSREDAGPFLEECRRVLRPGGVIRVAVPDLETIARQYLKALDQALAGNEDAAERHEWMTIELLDQLVRHYPGGTMLEHWSRNPMPCKNFVISRLGSEVKNHLGRKASLPEKNLDPLSVGQFRLSGEAHQWMYDRFSLARLLESAGFADAEVVSATQSRIPGFARYNLDTEPSGEVRKPDSLFMEAVRKPRQPGEEAQKDSPPAEKAAPEEKPERRMQAQGKSNLIQRELGQISTAFEANDHAGVIRAAARLKSLRVRIQGLDLIRANAFMGLGETASAIEALKEELRYFPGNAQANELLDHLRKTGPVSGFAHVEFDRLHQAVQPYTMVGPKRLFSLYTLARRALQEGVPGHFAECGVAAGGSSALLAWVLKRYGDGTRRLFSFDSFEGMPEPTDADKHKGVPANDTGWGTGTCAAPMDSLKEICGRLGVLDLVQPVKGYFNETLPQTKNSIGSLAFLHMDGDWYESTKDILVNFYDLVRPGGLIQVDDYGHWEGCRKALDEFFAARGVAPDKHVIDGTGIWFVKPA